MVPKGREGSNHLYKGISSMIWLDSIRPRILKFLPPSEVPETEDQVFNTWILGLGEIFKIQTTALPVFN